MARDARSYSMVELVRNPRQYVDVNPVPSDFYLCCTILAFDADDHAFYDAGVLGSGNVVNCTTASSGRATGRKRAWNVSDVSTLGNLTAIAYDGLARPVSREPAGAHWTFNEFTFSHVHGVANKRLNVSGGDYGVYDSSGSYFSANRIKLAQDDGPGRPAGGWSEHRFIPIPRSPKVQFFLITTFAGTPPDSSEGEGSFVNYTGKFYDNHMQVEANGFFSR